MGKLMNAQEYEESLRRLNLNVYLFGRKVENVVDDPIIRPSMKAVAATYEYAHRPEYEDLLTTRSHLTGKKINRFTHIHQSADDLVKKSKMGRLLGSLTGLLLPALRGHGRHERPVHHHLRHRRQVRHGVQQALPEISSNTSRRTTWSATAP
ncbi:MAG: hypothetical protein MZV70_42315 [Desulfobacterales bacterium]|nr:hypothetical protein [Desulfobacterales bacterium]